MQKLHAFELIDPSKGHSEAPDADRNLFLSVYMVEDENETVGGKVENVFIREDITLNISRLTFKKDVEIISPYPIDIVGFTFCTKGKAMFKIPFESDYIISEDGVSTIYKTPSHEGSAVFEAGTEYEAVAIHLSLPKFLEIAGEELKELPAAYRDSMSEKEGHWLTQLTISTEVRNILQQITNHSFSGLSKQFFLESKVLELMALQLSQLSSTQKRPVIQRDDELKIRECESIIRDQFANPPSLLQLAREVGINDFKLKQGFKQLYGKPVFKYLQHFRLQKAHEYLKSGKMNVNEAAFEVGYSSVGAFSNAFYEHYGFRPAEAKAS